MGIGNLDFAPVAQLDRASDYGATPLRWSDYRCYVVCYGCLRHTHRLRTARFLRKQATLVRSAVRGLHHTSSKGELSPIPATARPGVAMRVMIAEKGSDAADCLGLLFARFFVWIRACLLTARLRGMGSPHAHKTGQRLQQLTGALCSRRKGHHP